MAQITSWPCDLLVKVESLELPEPGKATAVSAPVLATTFLAAEKRFSGGLLEELGKW
jgi:hypothetical protein